MAATEPFPFFLARFLQFFSTSNAKPVGLSLAARFHSSTHIPPAFPASR
jgi:hypothetical protein